jgi:SAM-dependent methyltransferase
MRLYGELASWWPVLSPPAEYAEEAGVYAQILKDASPVPPRTVLELGSGGGHNASYMRAHFELTLVDQSPEMLALSRTLNPECEHVQGDMRTIRLGRLFDAVFIHDAVTYMTTESDLLKAITTAFVHCAAGGPALFAPDHLRETFVPSTDHGGSDGPDRSMRYLEWTWDPDPTDTLVTVDYAYLLRATDGAARVEHDRHIVGLFGRADWLRMLADVGFVQIRVIPFAPAHPALGDYELFVALKPAGVSSGSPRVIGRGALTR